MSAYELDHLALAVPGWTEAAKYLVTVLGGEWKHGVSLPAFSPCQVAFAEDMRIELLEPGTDEDSFVRKYVDGGGGRSRPHHITFKVKNVEDALWRAEEHGFEPIQVRIDNDVWREAFLHPKDTGLGFLTQFVEAPEDPLLDPDSPFGAPTPDWLPVGGPEPVAMPFLFGRVRDWDRVRSVLVGVLGGRPTDLDSNNGARTVEFAWEEGARLVLTSEDVDARGTGIEAVVAVRGERTGDWADYRAAVESAEFVPALGVKVAFLDR